MAIESHQLVFRTHAVKRMFQRNISEKEVRHVIENGEVIESYRDDTPYPSRLVLGWVKTRPLHVVAAENRVERQEIIITVYEPDAKEWDPTFTRRSQ